MHGYHNNALSSMLGVESIYVDSSCMQDISIHSVAAGVYSLVSLALIAITVFLAVVLVEFEGGLIAGSLLALPIVSWLRPIHFRFSLCMYFNNCVGWLYSRVIGIWSFIFDCIHCFCYIFWCNSLQNWLNRRERCVTSSVAIRLQITRHADSTNVTTIMHMHSILVLTH